MIHITGYCDFRKLPFQKREKAHYYVDFKRWSILVKMFVYEIKVSNPFLSKIYVLWF